VIVAISQGNSHSCSYLGAAMNQLSQRKHLVTFSPQASRHWAPRRIFGSPFFLPLAYRHTILLVIPGRILLTARTILANSRICPLKRRPSGADISAPCCKAQKKQKKQKCATCFFSSRACAKRRPLRVLAFCLPHLLALARDWLAACSAPAGF